jgi:hypothetical protein
MSRSYKDTPLRLIWENIEDDLLFREVISANLKKAQRKRLKAISTNTLKASVKADWYEWCVLSKQQAQLKNVVQDQKQGLEDYIASL